MLNSGLICLELIDILSSPSTFYQECACNQ